MTNISRIPVHALQSQTLGWVATSVHALLFFLSFLPFLSSRRTAMSSRMWHLMTVMAAWDPRVKLVLTGNGCRWAWGYTMRHVTCTANFTKTTQVAATLVKRLPKLQRRLILKSSFGLVISQNLAWLHEIAKMNTRKIVTIAISQNFVLA